MSTFALWLKSTPWNDRSTRFLDHIKSCILYPDCSHVWIGYVCTNEECLEQEALKLQSAAISFAEKEIPNIHDLRHAEPDWQFLLNLVVFRNKALLKHLEISPYSPIFGEKTSIRNFRNGSVWKRQGRLMIRLKFSACQPKFCESPTNAGLPVLLLSTGKDKINCSRAVSKKRKLRNLLSPPLRPTKAKSVLSPSMPGIQEPCHIPQELPPASTSFMPGAAFTISDTLIPEEETRQVHLFPPSSKTHGRYKPHTMSQFACQILSPLTTQSFIKPLNRQRRRHPSTLLQL